METPQHTNKWAIFIACGLMVVLVNLDMTIINLALPDMADFFHISLNKTQWIMSIYLFVTAACFALFGRLADDFGRKRIFLLGVLLFTLGSVFAGIAHHLYFLLFARFVQGLGFAATLGLSIIIIIPAFPVQQKGFVTGLVVTISGASQAIGPILGGVILQHFPWHWIFLINLPIGLVSFVASIIFIPKDTDDIKKSNLSIINVVLFIFSLSFILYALNQVVIISQITFWSLLFIGFLLFGVFAYSSLKHPKPLIDLTLISNKVYLKVMFTRFIFMIYAMSLLFLLPLYLENILNFSPLHTGLIMLSLTIAFAISASVAGKLIDRIGFFPILLFSLICALFSLVAICFYQTTMLWFVVLFGLLLIGIGFGMHIPSSVNGVLSNVKEERSGTAIGLFYTAAMVGAVIGVAISGNIIHVTSLFHLKHMLAWLHLFPSEDLLAMLELTANGVRNPNVLLHDPQYQHIAKQSFILGFRWFLTLQALLMLINIAVCWQLREKTDG